MRILITGSRDWASDAILSNAVAEAIPDNLTRVTLVHGACPTGADLFASQLARRWRRFNEEAHPADWDTHGRAAGPIRNQAMVDLGADLCLAFIGPCTSPRCHKPGRHPSHGATHCADRAEKAGIPTRRYLA